MALLDILIEGDPRLRQKAVKITRTDESLVRLAEDMHETMDEAPGVGLAGPQVGVMRRIITVHVPADEDEDREEDIRMTLINPEIVKGFGKEEGQEGCLSIPRWYGLVPRMTSITVKGMNLENKHVRFKAEGFLARVLQHEIDHLDGILFIDRIEDESSLMELTDEEMREGDAPQAE
jgi:peptide deformylase